MHVSEHGQYFEILWILSLACSSCDTVTFLRPLSRQIASFLYNFLISRFLLMFSFIWFLQLWRWAYFSPQYWHTNGFSFVCVLICSVILSLSGNFLPQVEHWNFHSSGRLWYSMWTPRLKLLLKAFPHSEQICDGGSCDFMWVLVLSLI